METQQTTVLFLGADTTIPEPDDDTPCLLVNGQVLFDTGWAAPLRMRQFGVSPMQLRYVFITHWHTDHCLALPSLLFHIRYTNKQRKRRGQSVSPMPKIVGPTGDIGPVLDAVRTLISCPDDGFESVAVGPGQAIEDHAISVDVFDVNHVPNALAYRLTDKVTGKVVFYSGDTAYHPPLAQNARNADLLVHDVGMGLKSHRPDRTPRHSTPIEAANIAKAANVKRLALVHAPRETHPEVLARAQSVFANSIVPAVGQTIVLD